KRFGHGRLLTGPNDADRASLIVGFAVEPGEHGREIRVSVRIDLDLVVTERAGRDVEVDGDGLIGVVAQLIPDGAFGADRTYSIVRHKSNLGSPGHDVFCGPLPEFAPRQIVPQQFQMVTGPIVDGDCALSHTALLLVRGGPGPTRISLHGPKPPRVYFTRSFS